MQISSHCPQILQIKIDDPVVMRELALRDTPDAQAEYGEELLEIGARVVQSTRPATEAAQVAGVLEGFQRKSQQQSEAIADKLDQHIDRTREELTSATETMERETDAHAQSLLQLRQHTEEILSAAVARMEDGLVRNEADYERMAETFESSLRRALAELNSQVGRAEQVVSSGLAREEALLAQAGLREQASSRKGAAFEQLMLQDLRTFASGRGDLVELTGATASSGGTDKKGDLFYSMDVEGRTVPIVLECKDQKLTTSGKNPLCLAELETAMEKRGGQYGIVVANLEPNSADGHPNVPVLSFHGENRFVVLVDREQPHPVALETVLRLIHQKEKSKPAAEKKEFDVNAVSAVVEKLVRNTSEFRYLRSTCTNLSNSLLDLRERIQGLEDQQKAHAADLQALLTEAA